MEGVTGSLTWLLAPEGKGTKVTQSYVVGGYIRSNAAVFASTVDDVLGEQLTRLKSSIEQPAK